MLNSITDIFFDLDHTLWDFDKNSALAFQRVFLKHKVDLNMSDFIREYEPVNLAYWKRFREDEISKQQLRRGRLIDTFTRLNIEFSLSQIDALADTYIKELPGDNHLFEGATEALDYLERKYKLHIITNGFEEVQHLKLRKSGIAKYFQTVTTSDEVGMKKPHPSIFDFALRKAAAMEQNSMMIGDSYEADILGAQAVGMGTVFFNYREEIISSSNNITIKSLSELREHF